MNVDDLSVFDSNTKMQIYMFLVILVMNKINTVDKFNNEMTDDGLHVSAIWFMERNEI